MVDERTPPTLGLVSCILVLGVVAAPYLFLSDSAVAGVQPYYAYGIVGPWVITLLAVVTFVAFAAGRQNRSDPVMMAGATLVFGVFLVGMATVWALSVPTSLVQQLGSEAWLEYHRWVLLAASALVPVAGAWYARTLGVL